MAADGDEKQSIKTHVPVALDAFNVFAPLKPASHACACAEISAYLTAAPALSTYKMLQKGDQTSYGFELVNLHARAVQLGKAHNEPSVSFSKPTELTYKIEWQYSDVDNQSSTRRRMKNTKLHVWLDITSGRPLMMRARIASSAAASCLMDIAIIREVLKQPTSRTKTGLSSPYKLGHDEISPVKTPNARTQERCDGNAAALATIKVAASEYPNHMWIALGSDPLAAEGALIPDNGGDAFGRMVTSKTVRVPRILPAKQQRDIVQAHHDIFSSKVIVTGGLGGVLLLLDEFKG